MITYNIHLNVSKYYHYLIIYRIIHDTLIVICTISLLNVQLSHNERDVTHPGGHYSLTMPGGHYCLLMPSLIFSTLNLDYAHLIRL